MSDLEGWGGSDCAVFEEMLAGFEAGDLKEAASELVRRHVDSCASCAGKLAALSESAEKERAAWDEAVEPSPAEAQPNRLATRGPSRDRPWVLKPIPLLIAGLVLAAGAAGVRFLAAGPTTNVVASLTGVGDEEARAHGFTLARPMDLRVYAVGEGMSGEMYDYAWIVDASTGSPVWTMKFGDTQHAGGADKNRMVDHLISLEPGSYIVYYKTDGSHSYEEWNSAKPSNPEHWGVTVLTMDSGDRTAIERYDPEADPAIVAQLIRVNDDQHLRQPFTLERRTEMRVYAIGEGMGNEMYDYAWIENARTRRTIWKMTYGETGHAGGAEKNRMVEGILRLPAGSYVLHYQSDDSHSYDSWNASPPVNPFNYGVTLRRTGR
jgi:hypothetical protein